MFLKQQLLYALAAMLFGVLCQRIQAEITGGGDNSLNQLYDSVLQREYAGPVVFPNHQVERKAQRSPSLRLRFGRRSDPDMPPSAVKRWFGDVNQKPIRSPSLRLRFGRRSDPSMPLHSSFDALMNDLAVDNAVDNAIADYADDEAYERIARKPQRLRWGRSIPMFAGESVANSGNNNGLVSGYDGDEESEHNFQRNDEFLNSLLSADKLRNMLLTLRQFEGQHATAAAAAVMDDLDDLDNGDQFEREVRKAAPLRLRWGRSTGGVTPASAGAAGGAETGAQQKKISSAKNALNAENTQFQQSQPKN